MKNLTLLLSHILFPVFLLFIVSFSTSAQVKITGGTFKMGSENVLEYGASPSHSVRVSDFYISSTEINWGTWDDVATWGRLNGYADLPIGGKGYTNGTGDATHPVTRVNWYDVLKWCNARSEREGLTPVYYTNTSFTSEYIYKTGEIDLQNSMVSWETKGYRLPTEAEWEYAARGGNKSSGFTYSGSNIVADVAWHYWNSGQGTNYTHPVATKVPNELGLYDMSGSLWEWCWDRFGSYSSSAQTNPYGEPLNGARVLRGGSINNMEEACRVAYRNSQYTPNIRDYDAGFRVTLTLSVPKDLIAKTGNAQVILNWKKVADSNFKRFRIYGGITSPTTILIDSTDAGNINDTTKTIVGLLNGTIYYFRVTEVDSLGLESGYSNEVTAIPNIPPIINSFTPSSGSIGTNVTINGANFSSITSNNVVYFGAVKALVNSATSTALTVTVPFGSTYSPIVVTNLSTGLTANSSKPFIVTFSGGGSITTSSFGPKVDFPTGDSPQAVEIGDVDGDGKIDFVVTSYNNNAVSVFRNTGTSGNITSSTFASKFDFTTGTTTFGVAIGDLDGDGKLDFTIANGTTNTVSVFRNTSTSGSITTGSFATKVDFTTGLYPKSVAIGDIDGDGKPDLVVGNMNGNNISVFRNTSTSGSITAGSFATKVDFTTGTGRPQDVIISDVDGDNKPDLIVADGDSTISVFRNISSVGSIAAGTFEAKVDFKTGAWPRNISICDLDEDGKPDLVVAGDKAVSVLKNTSVIGSITTGSFAAKVDFMTGADPHGVAISDVDGDVKPDIVVTNYTGSTVSVFRNTSSLNSITSSSFAPNVDFATGGSSNDVAIGDIDGDGKPDLVVTNQSSNTVSILRNKVGPINLSPTPPQNLSAIAGNSQVLLNWNKNTESDFLKYRIYIGVDSVTMTLTDSSTASILDTTKTVSGLTNGTKYYFLVTALDSARSESGKSFAVSATPYSPTSVVFFTPTSNALNVLLNSNITVTFNNEINSLTLDSSTIKVNGSVSGLHTLGFNYMSSTKTLTITHSKPFKVGEAVTIVLTREIKSITGDTLVKSYSWSFTTNTTGGSFKYVQSSTPSVGNNPISVTAGDFNGDGSLDLAVANNTLNKISVLSNNGSGSFTQTQTPSVGNNPRAIISGDLNGDGFLDLAVANTDLYTVSILLNNGNGTFTVNSTPTVGNSPWSIITRDFNGDGYLDIVVTNSTNPGTVSILLNNRNGTFTLSSTPSVGSYPGSVTSGDFNSDGYIDLAVTNSQSGNVSILLNDGTGTFTLSSSKSVGANPQSITSGDFNGDGYIDLAVANFSSNTISILLNNGNSIFTESSTPSVGNNPYSVTTGDFNNDGFLDVAVANYGSNTVSILSNNGTGIFTQISTPSVGSYPISVTSGDFNNDGKLDLAVANNSANTVSILLNDMPLTPQNLTATAGNAQVTLKWSKNTESDFLKYRIYIGSDSTTMSLKDSSSASINDTTKTITGLTNGTKYYFRVSAMDSARLESGLSFAVSTIPFFPPPTITSFTPTIGPIGSIVTISGSNFNTTLSNNIVFFGAVKAQINSVSATSIIVTVPVGASFGPILLISKNLVSLSSQFFIPTFSGGNTLSNSSFSNSVNINYPMPYSIEGCDFDGDGKIDIATTSGSINGVSFLRNTSIKGILNSSSFAPKTDFLLPNTPGCSIRGSGYLDGDGKIDLIVSRGDSVFILRNTSTVGSINFERVIFSDRYYIPKLVGDVNGDGKLDLMVWYNDSLNILLNVSTPGSIIYSPKIFILKSITVPYYIKTADFDGDGKVDIVANYINETNVFPLENITVFQNKTTNGILNLQKIQIAKFYSENIAIGDLDGDSKLDIVLACTENGGGVIGEMRILRNTSSAGTIAFADPILLKGESNIYGVTLSDFNGDNKPDIVSALANYNNGNGFLLYENTTPASGIISYNSYIKYSTGQTPSMVLACDFDGDGKTDIAVNNYTTYGNSSNTITVLRNKLIEVLYAPRNLITTVGNSQIALKWSKNTEASFLKYYVYIGSDSTTMTLKDSTSASITDTTKTISGLVNGTKYYFRVSALDSAKLESGQSYAVSGTPFMRRAKLAISAVDSDRIAISWQPFIGVKSYKILSGNDSISLVQKYAISDSSCIDSLLIPSTIYYYRVICVDSSNIYGDTSFAVSAVTKPSIPTNLSTTFIGDSTVSLAWQSNGGPAQQYKVLRSSDNISFEIRALTNVKYYIDFTVLPTTSYWYRIIALNSLNVESNPSNTINITTKKPLARILSIGKITQHRSSIKIPYSIFIGIDDTVSITALYSINNGSTFDTIKNLQGFLLFLRNSNTDSLLWLSGKDYSGESDSAVVKIIPFGISGEGYSFKSQMFVLDNKMPLFAGVKTITSDSTKLIVSWNNGTDISAPLKYNVYKSLTSTIDYSQISATVSGTSVTLSGLKNYQTYYIAVRAVDTLGNIDTNTIVKSGIPTALSRITTIATLSGTKSGTINIPFAYSVAANDTAKMVILYSVDGGTSFDTIRNVSKIISQKTNSGIDTIQWQSALEYKQETNSAVIKIIPVGIGGDGYSFTSNSFGLDNKIPSFSGLSKAKSDSVGTSVKLEWSNANDLSKPIKYFVFSSSEPTSLFNSVANDTIITDTIATVTNVVPFTRYYFGIRAADNAGNIDTNKKYQSVIPSRLIRVASVFSPTSVFRTNIPIKYTLTAAKEDTASIEIQYSTNSGSSWNVAQTIIGKKSPITQFGIEQAVSWDCLADLPNVENNKMRVKILPTGRGGDGIEGSSVDFTIDTKVPQFAGLSTVERSLLQSGSVILKWNPAIDSTKPVTYFIHKAVNGQTLTYQNAIDSTTNVQWTGKNYGFNVPYLFAVRSRDGVGNIDSNKINTTFTLPPLADFSGNRKIDGEDLTIFKNAWKTQDTLIADVGPATGLVPYLQPKRDHKIDFEDLMVFGQMWNWSLDNPNGFFFSKSGSASMPSVSLGINESAVIRQRETKKFTIKFGDEVEIGTVELNVKYDSSKIQIDSITLSSYKGMLVFDRISNEKGSASIVFTSRGDTLHKLLQQKDFLRLWITAKEKLNQSPVVIRGVTYSNKAEVNSISEKTVEFNWRPATPETFELSQNFPNPFNPSTTIEYQLPKDAKVTLKVFNLLGQEVAVLADGEQKAGYYSAQWNARSMSSGVYIYRLYAKEFVQTKKMILMK